MNLQIDNIIKCYKTLSKIPSIVQGKLNKSATKLSAKWSLRNIDKGKSTKYLYSYILGENLSATSESDFGLDISNELSSVVSPTQTFKAIIREEKEGKDSKKQYLEVWKASRLTQCIELTALDIHGDVYADSEFGSISWSPDESKIVYIAEKKLKKSESYIKRKSSEDSTKDGNGDKVIKKGEEFLYKQDWGEQLVGKYLSVIVVCHLEDERFTILEGLPESWCPGQVRFAPDGNSVVGVAWETEPRRLGLMFCTNRHGCIFNLTLDGHMTRLSEDGMAVRSPRFSPNGDVVWLQRKADGPHHACHELIIKKKETDVLTTVIPIVQNDICIANGDKFYGIYSAALPNDCFSADGARILFSTPQINEMKSFVVDVDGGRIVDISNKCCPGSTTILDVKSNVVLASFSNMTTPSSLYVAYLPETGEEHEIQWVLVDKQDDVQPASTVEYLNLRHENTDDAVKSFSAIYFAPPVENDKMLPLIVWPHGGPHSSFINTYSLEAAFYNMLGFACVQINYRGSTGAGQASVEYLPKRVGDSDVKDCKLATDEVLKKYLIDEKKVCLSGGSHGGFLVTHLSGQYPDVYCAVVSRNPVIDIASMFNSTDIADWCAVEAGFEFNESGEPSEEQLLAMRRCSPIVHVHKVRAPTALMLGSGDKRVPHYQGLEYARRLRANSVPVRIYMYEDNHSLSSLPAEMDNLINSASWFMKHIRIEA